MAGQIISIVVLLVVFVLGTFRPVNLGALALVATFGVGLWVAHEDLRKVTSGFPVDVFILLFGVTYLFGIASVNGTIEWLVRSAAKLVRDNRIVIPWLLFLIAAIPTTAGAAGPVGVALLAPVALRMAEKHNLSPKLAGLMVINGSNAGNFSPLNVLGVIVNGTVRRNGIDVNPAWLWLGNLVFTILLGVAVFLIYGGLALIREARQGEAKSEGESEPPAPLEPVVPRVATLIAILGVACGALVFSLDIGALAVVAAVTLHLLLPSSSAGAMNKVSWNTVLLICGVVTYVALLQRMGTVRMIGDSVAGIGAPLLAALLLCFIAAVTSAFASSIGVLGAMIPLAVPFLLSGDVAVTGMVIALAICATAVDATPFSSIGALTVASAPEQEREPLYRGLIRWGFSIVLVAPVTTWLVFVVL